MFKNIKNSMNSAKEKVDSVASDLTSTALYVANSVINLANLICKKKHTLYVFNVYEK